jgi:hypothetical protein
LIVTTTCCFIRRFVTFTLIPRGKKRYAAVNCCREKRSPLAVLRPCCCFPYQEAKPTCLAFTCLVYTWLVFAGPP